MSFNRLLADAEPAKAAHAALVMARATVAEPTCLRKHAVSRSSSSSLVSMN